MGVANESQKPYFALNGPFRILTIRSNAIGVKSLDFSCFKLYLGKIASLGIVRMCNLD